MKSYKQNGISFPNSLWNDVDRHRGDIPRSRFIQRIVEKYFLEKEIQNDN
jgi:metal-responsive CopG/Arc/MetJ family transcriptional regulator